MTSSEGFGAAGCLARRLIRILEPMADRLPHEESAEREYFMPSLALPASTRNPGAEDILASPSRLPRS